MHPPVMKRFLSHCLLIIVVLSFNFSCRSVYRGHSLHYKNYQINEAVQKDSSLLALMRPYGDSVNQTMNEVIGFVDLSLIKKKPEGTLGNFMADAYFIMAGEKFNMKIDAAFMNDGGIRLDELAAGPVTRGKIFELMPFDNILIIQKIKGSVLQEFLNLIATQRGWPVAGITMQIKDLPAGQAGKKAINVFIDGQPLDTNKIYTTVNSDFIANGGNNADMLKQIPQINNGYLVRDALFDYIKKLERQGKKISAKIENRVTHVQ
jgi:2',3'-cyclic-nucleotide 2'-phosphodiesterase (5'-nucleotidase family)